VHGTALACALDPPAPPYPVVPLPLRNQTWCYVLRWGFSGKLEEDESYIYILAEVEVLHAGTSHLLKTHGKPQSGESYCGVGGTSYSMAFRLSSGK